jgi:hypothetical protein
MSAMRTTNAVGHDGAGAFGFDEMLDSIATESHAMAEAIAHSDLEARVPSTPKWSVRDLGHHIGVE